jgi:hypothetical protein
MADVEATKQKVQRMLVAEFENIRLAKDSFAIEYESTIIWVEVKEWIPDDDGTPRSLVHVWAPLGREVPASPELYHWAATEGQGTWFGSVSVMDAEDGKTCMVVFDATLLADFLDPAELATTVYAIGFSGNEFDDLVHDRFGGKRFTDE